MNETVVLFLKDYKHHFLFVDILQGPDFAEKQEHGTS